MPAANLHQILFVFSTRPHEELMRLSGTVLSSGQERIRAWHCRSHPLAPATGPKSGTHLWSLRGEAECVCAHEEGRKTLAKQIKNKKKKKSQMTRKRECHIIFHICLKTFCCILTLHFPVAGVYTLTEQDH